MPHNRVHRTIIIMHERRRCTPNGPRKTFKAKSMNFVYTAAALRHTDNGRRSITINNENSLSYALINGLLKCTRNEIRIHTCLPLAFGLWLIFWLSNGLQYYLFRTHNIVVWRNVTIKIYNTYCAWLVAHRLRVTLQISIKCVPRQRHIFLILRRYGHGTNERILYYIFPRRRNTHLCPHLYRRHAPRSYPKRDACSLKRNKSTQIRKFYRTTRVGHPNNYRGFFSTYFLEIV